MAGRLRCPVSSGDRTNLLLPRTPSVDNPHITSHLAHSPSWAMSADREKTRRNREAKPAERNLFVFVRSLLFRGKCGRKSATEAGAERGRRGGSGTGMETLSQPNPW